jgi:hypothetical protein
MMMRGSLGKIRQIAILVGQSHRYCNLQDSNGTLLTFYRVVDGQNNTALDRCIFDIPLEERLQSMQAATEEPTTSKANTLSRLRALRNRFQQPRTQVTQATTEDPQ